MLRPPPSPPELVIFVGLQAAGKSSYYHARFAATHVHVSKDLMKNVRDRDLRQRQMIESALAAGQSVVVDNTNPTPLVRAPLIELGRAHGARVIACFFESTVKDAVARNRTREGKARVPDVAIYVTAKKLVPPKFEEGFDEVRVIAPLPPPA
ncbi:MAG: AAA family ATPase [Thermoanaerobaculia bacterium]